MIFYQTHYVQLKLELTVCIVPSAAIAHLFSKQTAQGSAHIESKSSLHPHSLHIQKHIENRTVIKVDF